MICKNIKVILIISLFFSLSFIILPSENVKALDKKAEDLIEAILINQSTYITNSGVYDDLDNPQHRQAIVCTSPMGLLEPTHNSSFILLSTGIAGSVPVTTDSDEDGYPDNPGDERGAWFKSLYGYPRDFAELEFQLQVPANMYCVQYYIRFLSAEFPEYVNTKYNDKVTITVVSPSQGTHERIISVNNASVQVWSSDMQGTGFDIFSIEANPDKVDIVNLTPILGGDDAGATPLQLFEHPVSPGEIVTITFRIEDVGDNLFDSTVFIDSLGFSEEMQRDIIARKSAYDENGDLVEGSLECGTVIKYIIKLNNIGQANQYDNPGDEFVDFIPDNTTYVSGSAIASSGSISFNPAGNNITWNGMIPSLSTVTLEFQVIINAGVANDTIISNQGTVFWDSNGYGVNDETELTDDPNSADGIDQDEDGETNDDDPTNITVIAYDYPSVVTEDFTDDTSGESAIESYLGRRWFETSNCYTMGNIFEVSSNYYYSTLKSFGMKIRSTGSPQYWNYSLLELEGDIVWWESWFTCGNWSEKSDLNLTFMNSNGQIISKLHFEYFQNGDDYLTDWVIKLYCYDTLTGWHRLYSDYPGGYLFNDWYKIRIEKNTTSTIDYKLYNSQGTLVYLKTKGLSGATFSDLKTIEFTSTKNPIVCPLFFWDEHSIGLIYN
ncbi:MAG: choice-of-anchor L domain-containing protein [Thermoplasmatales archaeon]|nr:MAG: choice-of-anchor L domain-containing protein [Thermoplasmatales archaeon]